MILNLGDYAAGATVYVPFHTFDSNDPSASVTTSGLAVTDIEIYKDGSTTQRASDSGYALLDTDGIDFDGITGLHGFSIDLSDNTDAGFFAAGSQYWVAVSAITVDGATINFWAAVFTIARTGGVATILTDTEAVLTDSEAIIADTEAVLTDTEASQTSESAILTDTEAAITARSTILTDTEAVLADTEASQTAETNLLADTEAILTDSEAILADSEAILTDTGTTIPAVLGSPSDFGSGTSTLAANLQDMADNGTAVFDRSTDSLQAMRDALITDSEAVLSDTEAVLTDSEAVLVDTEASQTAEAAILADTEASQTSETSLLADTEAVLTDAEAILSDSEAVLADTELWVTAHSEPTGVPSASETPLDKIGYLFMGFRNKVTATSSKITVHDDADNAEFEYDQSDDGTTYTRTEANSV